MNLHSATARYPHDPTEADYFRAGCWVSCADCGEEVAMIAGDGIQKGRIEDEWCVVCDPECRSQREERDE